MLDRVLALGIHGDRTEVHIKEIWFSKSVGRKDPKGLGLLWSLDWSF